MTDSPVPLPLPDRPAAPATWSRATVRAAYRYAALAAAYCEEKEVRQVARSQHRASGDRELFVAELGNGEWLRENPDGGLYSRPPGSVLPGADGSLVFTPAHWRAFHAAAAAHGKSRVNYTVTLLALTAIVASASPLLPAVLNWRELGADPVLLAAQLGTLLVLTLTFAAQAHWRRQRSGTLIRHSPLPWSGPDRFLDAWAHAQRPGDPEGYAVHGAFLRDEGTLAHTVVKAGALVCGVGALLIAAGLLPPAATFVLLLAYPVLIRLLVTASQAREEAALVFQLAEAAPQDDTGARPAAAPWPWTERMHALGAPRDDAAQLKRIELAAQRLPDDPYAQYRMRTILDTDTPELLRLTRHHPGERKEGLQLLVQTATQLERHDDRPGPDVQAHLQYLRTLAADTARPASSVSLAAPRRPGEDETSA